MSYLFTSESVSEGHPDKVADQISDAVLDAYLTYDPNAKVACETFVTTGLTIIGGEIKSNPDVKKYIDINDIVRDTIKRIGYTKSEYQFDAISCGILNCMHEQSPDINQGVVRESEENQGAGDQGLMFGYACNETDNFMPLTLELSHLLLQELAAIRKEGTVMTYLRPDSKAQVTIAYDDNHKPLHIDTIVLSTQHDEFDSDEKMHAKISQDVIEILIPRCKAKLSASNQALFTNNIQYHINPTGKFVIGGPHGDTGLTGRKIIVDTYGGRGAHGGGAFSGKDPSKVDRSAAYAARHIAKNFVAAGVAQQLLVQVAYAIGVAQPVGIYVNSYGTGVVPDKQISDLIVDMFDLRPSALIKRLKLQSPIYSPTASYGHMGREYGSVNIHNASTKQDNKFESFTWEQLNFVSEIKSTLGL